MLSSYVLHRDFDAPDGPRVTAVARITLEAGRTFMDHSHASWCATQNTDGAWSLHLGSDHHIEVEVLPVCYSAQEGLLSLRSTRAGDLFVAPSGEPFVFGEHGALDALSLEWMDQAGMDFAELDQVLGGLPSAVSPPVNAMLALVSTLGMATRVQAGFELPSAAPNETHAQGRHRLAAELHAAFREAYVAAPSRQAIHALLFLVDRLSGAGGLTDDASPDVVMREAGDHLTGESLQHLERLAQSLPSRDAQQLREQVQGIIQANALVQSAPVAPEGAPELIDWGW